MAAAKALVTGGSGYFGCVLVDRLLAEGYAVRIFDLNENEDRPKAAEMHRGDIRDMDAVARACAGIDVVYHNVAQVPLAKDRELFESVNRGGTGNLLKAAFAAGVRKLVYTSSSAVFGVPKGNPVTEETSPAPIEDYGRAKLAGERLCRERAGGGLDVSIIRPRTILGHGRLGIFQILFEWVFQGYNIPVLGRGDSVYQFVHAEDLAGACIKASRRSGAEVFNCGAQSYGTMRETLQALCDHAATGSKLRGVPMAPAVALMRLTSLLGLSPLGPYHALMYGRSLYFDITKARSILDWRPKYSNIEMMIESYDWYLRNRETVLAGGRDSPHRSAVRQGVLSLVKHLL